MATLDPDPAEVARYVARRHCPFATIRYASHVQDRDPTNVWAPLKLAEVVTDPLERCYHLNSAVVAGQRKWAAELSGKRKIRWWDRPETRPFMTALFRAAKEHGQAGMWDYSLVRIRELLELDPMDRIGAEALAKSLGLTSEVDIEAGRALYM